MLCKMSYQTNKKKSLGNFNQLPASKLLYAVAGRAHFLNTVI